MMYTLKALAFELYLQPNTKNHIAITTHSQIYFVHDWTRKTHMFTHHIWTNMMPYLDHLQAIWALPPVRALPPGKKCILETVPLCKQHAKAAKPRLVVFSNITAEERPHGIVNALRCFAVLIAPPTAQTQPNRNRGQWLVFDGLRLSTLTTCQLLMATGLDIVRVLVSLVGLALWPVHLVCTSMLRVQFVCLLQMFFS